MKKAKHLCPSTFCERRPSAATRRWVCDRVRSRRGICLPPVWPGPKPEEEKTAGNQVREDAKGKAVADPELLARIVESRQTLHDKLELLVFRAIALPNRTLSAPAKKQSKDHNTCTQGEAK